MKRVEQFIPIKARDLQWTRAQVKPFLHLRDTPVFYSNAAKANVYTLQDLIEWGISAKSIITILTDPEINDPATLGLKSPPRPGVSVKHEAVHAVNAPCHFVDRGKFEGFSVVVEVNGHGAVSPCICSCVPKDTSTTTGITIRVNEAVDLERIKKLLEDADRA